MTPNDPTKHLDLRVWGFLVLVCWCLVVVAAIGLYIDGLHANRITLGDRSAGSITLATDLAAYKVLLWASPSPAWRQYYSDVVEEKGREEIFQGDAQAYHRMRTGRIIELPNGTGAEQIDRVVLTLPDTPGSVAAIRIRVRTGPRKGLEAWTSPYMLQHDVPQL